MEVLSLDKQKEALLYAPKDLLWKIAEEEDAWLKLLAVIPEEYYDQFLDRLRLLSVEDPNQIKNMARVYIQNKVSLDHLQEAMSAVWNPEDLEEATSWLKENDFLGRPLQPLNLQASPTNADEIRQVVAQAAQMPKHTRQRLARKANWTKPKAGNPPEGASPEAAKCWNAVLRDPKKRRTILSPKSVHDQWALAHKFWLCECAKQGIPVYKSPADSISLHAKSSLKRSIGELHNSLCYDGYNMSRPASRLLRQLFDQLVKDGYEIGAWVAVRPKTPKGI